ncbi:MAG TPA: hypothetical protein VF974_01070 [Patescibacteria group bacterium]
MRKDKNNRMTDAELEALVAKLSPKEARLDQNFKQDLNYRLHSEISRLGGEKQNKSTINFNFMNKFKYVLSAIGAVAIVALIFVALPKNKGTVLLPGKQQVTKINDKAFGSLATLTVASGKGSGGGMDGANAFTTAPQATANSKMAAPSTMGAPSSTVGGMGGGTANSDMLIYRPVNYNFVYKGKDFTIDPDKMPVYERQKGFGVAVNLDTVLKNFNVGSFNIGKFNSARLDNLTATQDQDKGYTLNMDFREGNVYIGQNWERWPNIYASCADQACYEQNRITESQLPSNDEAINLANQFLTDYGIDKNGFGAPFVQDNWKVNYMMSPMSMKSAYYIPEMLSVIYPTKIEGHEIYDQSGNKTGMYVSIDVRSKRVSSIGELNSQRYQASDYATEKDVKRILALAEKGGYQNYYPMMEIGIKTEEVQLGDPVSGYVRLWQNVNNQSKELFVPSLIFPITNAPTNIYMKNVVVPIVKEVLDAQNDPGPPIRIMKGRAK